ncbi:MAG: PQQ-dependent sugar dehydrogenase [Actinobacteria bacterium]|nr:PQQ-dependent sugar dehydrogenase [Actinomycetota bacterium]
MPRLYARAAALAAVLAAAVALIAAPGASAAVTLPEKFEDQTVWSGLSDPMLVKFAPDGEVFVGEKGGRILVYENVNDPTPALFADLAKPVYDYEDHGLIGLAIDPLFDLGRPYVYALYTFNHKLADPGAQEPQGFEPRTQTPAWPSAEPNFEHDKCENSEKAKEEHKIENPGCEVSGVLVKLKADPAGTHAEPSAAEPEEDVLLEGWCQQATTHSIGDLGFGPEGDLYVSGGEGAMYSEADYGQFGNPCEDPVQYEEYEPGKFQVERLTALGGSLRSQSVLRDHLLPDHPTLLSGAILRINPDTGEGVPGNPYYASGEKNAQRIVGFGFRQPWRFSIDNRLGELYVSNVGNGSYEEIERLTLGSSTPYNGGWPCYEGSENGKPAKNYAYAGESAGQPYPSIQYCIDQYAAEEGGNPETETPFYAYPHNGPAVPGDRCYHGAPLATDVSGNVFNEGTAYAKSYRHAFFFSDAIRGCIYVMQSGADGKPEPATATTFLSDTEPYVFPAVDMEQGPEGNVFYVQLSGPGGQGSVHRIVYTGTSEGDEIEQGEKEQRERKEREEREARERKEREEREQREKGSNPEPPKPPVTTYNPPQIKQRPSKSTTKRVAKFVFGGTGETRFRCKLDGKGFTSCKSPKTYKHLKPGKHSFRVYVADAGGKRLSANRVFTWKIVAKS